MFSALPASEQSWSKGSDSLIVMHICAIWWAPNTGSMESPSTVSIKMHPSTFFFFPTITACFAFMWETSGIIFSFWSIPTVITAELPMRVVVGKQCFPFSPTDCRRAASPTLLCPQTDEIVSQDTPCWKGAACVSLSPSPLCPIVEMAVCVYIPSIKCSSTSQQGMCLCVLMSLFKTLSLDTIHFHSSWTFFPQC